MREAGTRMGTVVTLLLAVGCGLLVVAIHRGWFPGWSQRVLRDWVMHFVAVVGATLFTAVVLGYRGPAGGRDQRLRLVLACAVPLTVTLGHELGQWIWPAGVRDTFDSVRDALLNVGGAAAGVGVLRLQRRARS